MHNAAISHQLAQSMGRKSSPDAHALHPLIATTPCAPSPMLALVHGHRNAPLHGPVGSAVLSQLEPEDTRVC